jgi:hypothetical protein
LLSNCVVQNIVPWDVKITLKKKKGKKGVAVVRGLVYGK